MNKTPLMLLSLSLLYFAPLLVNTTGFITIGMAQAADSKPATRQSKIVPAMRDRVYSQLARAQKQADEGDKIGGFAILDEVKARLDSLNSYERAMLWNFYGFMQYGNDDTILAMTSFENVVREEGIPDSLYLSTLYSLAQLAMQQNNYPKALGYLKQWQSVNKKALTSGQNLLFAQIFYQDKQYDSCITHIDSAIAQALAKNDLPAENWLILQRAAYFELKQPKQVTKVMEQLVRYYNKAEYWPQLAAMYGEIGEEAKQLAVMEAAWQNDFITKPNDIISLVQLYLYHNVPYKAANLLHEAIDKGQVSAKEKYFNLLAQAYLMAKEDNKAIPVLQQAASIAETGVFDAQLAQAYLNTEHWQLAQDAAKKAIARGGLSSTGTMYLVAGMAQFNLKKYDQALTSLTQAISYAETTKVAKQWFTYVEKEQIQQNRLAMLN
jgi:hypothetical protein